MKCPKEFWLTTFQVLYNASTCWPILYTIFYDKSSVLTSFSLHFLLVNIEGEYIPLWFSGVARAQCFPKKVCMYPFSKSVSWYMGSKLGVKSSLPNLPRSCQVWGSFLNSFFSTKKCIYISNFLPIMKGYTLKIKPSPV